MEAWSVVMSSFAPRRIHTFINRSLVSSDQRLTPLHPWAQESLGREPRPLLHFTGGKSRSRSQCTEAQLTCVRATPPQGKQTHLLSCTGSCAPQGNGPLHGVCTWERNACPYVYFLNHLSSRPAFSLGLSELHPETLSSSPNIIIS